MKQLVLIFSFCLLFTYPVAAQLIDFSTLEKGTVTDNEGNVYSTIKFGDTWWMTSNLRTKHYNDGSEILQMTKLIDDSDDTNSWAWWVGAGRWGYANLDSTTYDTYGLQYSWPAATNTKNGGICPDGWALADTTDWISLARLIVGEDSIIKEDVTTPTPTGGTQTIFETIAANGLGQYLKTDNGKVLGTNKYGDQTWIDGGLWKNNPTLSNECNGANMNITPSGNIGTAIEGFGTAVVFWTPNYVHADGSGQGRRTIYFSYTNHKMATSRFHQANLSCVRCVKRENATSISAISGTEVSLYPNPATNYIIATGATGNYRIIETQGRIVQTGQLSGESTQISIADIPKGLYFFKTGNTIKKFMKQ